MARDLAQAGVEVTVYETGELESLGHNWSDAMERIAFKDVGFEVPAEATTNVGPLVKSKETGEGIFEEHAYPKMDVWAPDLSCKKKIHFRYITTDRRALGKLLAKQAMEAGAIFKFNHEVTSLIKSGGNTLDEVVVEGVKVVDITTKEESTIKADVTIDDTGFKAHLRTQLPKETGIAEPFSDDEFAMVHRTVRRWDSEKKADDSINDYYRYAYHTGYHWIQELNEDEIDIGAGVKYNADVPSPKETVESAIAEHPSISDEVIRGGGGKCLVGKSPYSLVTKGFMVIGDAASQTIPMTGCGAGGAMIGGKLAAETILEAQKAGKYDIESLWSYNYKWFVRSGRGCNYAALTALRNILQALPNEDNSFLFNKDVFSGEMLTSSINGIFQVPTLSLMVKTLFGCISRPGLLLTLNKATTIGTKLYKHYLKYPEKWSATTFNNWRTKATLLFSKTKG